MSDKLDPSSWLVIIGVPVLMFVVMKKVLFTKINSLFKEVAAKLKLSYRPGLLGAGKVVGNYKGMDIIVRIGAKVPGAIFMAGQLVGKSWLLDNSGLKQVIVTLPKKVDKRVIGDNIVVWKNKLTYVFKPKGMFKSTTAADIVNGLKRAVSEAKKLS